MGAKSDRLLKKELYVLQRRVGRNNSRSHGVLFASLFGFSF